MKEIPPGSSHVCQRPQRTRENPLASRHALAHRAWHKSDTGADGAQAVVMPSSSSGGVFRRWCRYTYSRTRRFAAAPTGISILYMQRAPITGEYRRQEGAGSDRHCQPGEGLTDKHAWFEARATPIPGNIVMPARRFRYHVGASGAYHLLKYRNRIPIALRALFITAGSNADLLSLCCPQGTRRATGVHCF